MLVMNEAVQALFRWKGAIKHDTEPVYRPSYEAGVLLNEATIGCSHHANRSAPRSGDSLFRRLFVPDPGRSLGGTILLWERVKQIILVTGDAFALPTRDLKGIGKLIASIFPRIDTISMYASIRNIKDKTDEELLALRALKLNDFNIGVDSGSEAALAFFDEGFPLHEAKEQLLRLKRLGCCYSINLMLGAGDRGKGLESARANALLANLVQSRLIFGSPLHVDRGSALGRLIQA